MVNRLTIKDIVEYAAGLYSGEKKNNIEKSINESDSSKKTFKLFKSGLTSHKLARLHDADLVFKNILAKVEQNKSSKKNVFRPAYKRTLRKSFYMAGSIASTAVVLFLMMTALLKNPGILKTSQFYGYPKVTFNGKSLNIKKGFLIPEKATIDTGKDSKIYLSFNAGKIRVLQNSKLFINKSLLSDNKSALHILQRSGALLVKVKQDQLKTMSINTPHSLLNITGTSFSVLVSAEQTDVAVLKGRVRVTSKTTRKTTDLNKYEFAEITIKTLIKKKLPLSLINIDDTWGNLRRSIITDYGKKIKNRADKRSVTKGFKERVILRNGTIITGHIISQTKDVVTIKSHLGIMNIPRSKIKKVDFLR